MSFSAARFLLSVRTSSVDILPLAYILFSAWMIARALYFHGVVWTACVGIGKIWFALVGKAKYMSCAGFFGSVTYLSWTRCPVPAANCISGWDLRDVHHCLRLCCCCSCCAGSFGHFLCFASPRWPFSRQNSGMALSVRFEASATASFVSSAEIALLAGCARPGSG